MAEKYIINVQPKLSGTDGKKLENDLNKRFSRVAEKFGGSLKKVGTILKGALAAAAAGVVASVAANPYEEVSKNIDETTGKAAELMDKANQYNVSAGKMFMAQQLLESKGVKDFDSILDRFAVKLEQARTGESATLQEFTNEKDIIDALFLALQSIGKLTGEEQAKMLQEIFGGRQGFSLAPVVSEDLMGRSKMLFGEQRSSDFEALIKKLDDVADWRDVTKSWLEQERLQMNSRAITKNAVSVQRDVEFQKAQRAAKRMEEIETYAKIAQSTDKMAESLDRIQDSVLGAIAPTLEDVANTNNWIMQNIKKHGAWRGIGKSTGLWGD